MIIVLQINYDYRMCYNKLFYLFFYLLFHDGNGIEKPWQQAKMGLHARKPVFGGLGTTTMQTSLRIPTDCSAPLLIIFWKAKGTVQSLYNTIFGSIGLHHVISELCYKGTILQRKYRKMTILWSFFYNSFLIFHDLKFGNHNMTVFYPNPCFFKVYYKGTALYLVN